MIDETDVEAAAEEPVPDAKEAAPDEMEADPTEEVATATKEVQDEEVTGDDAPAAGTAPAKKVKVTDHAQGH